MWKRNWADFSEVADATKRTLGDDVSVFTGNKRGRAEFVDAAESNIRLIAISGSLGGIGLFVAVLVIAGCCRCSYSSGSERSPCCERWAPRRDRFAG